jgi:hypothetical protein
MKVLSMYRPTVPEGFEWVVPTDSADFEFLREFDGTQRKHSWTPIVVNLLRVDDTGVLRRPADLPWLGDNVLVLTSRAVGAIGELLEEFGELLPLACDDAELFVFNPLRVIDALDAERSEVIRFSTGRVVDIPRYVLRRQAVEGMHVFKIPEMTRGSLLVSSLVVDAVNEADLRGTEFQRVWSDGADCYR